MGSMRRGRRRGRKGVGIKRTEEGGWVWVKSGLGDGDGVWRRAGLKGDGGAYV